MSIVFSGRRLSGDCVKCSRRGEFSSSISSCVSASSIVSHSRRYGLRSLADSVSHSTKCSRVHVTAAAHASAAAGSGLALEWCAGHRWGWVCMGARKREAFGFACGALVPRIVFRGARLRC